LEAIRQPRRGSGAQEKAPGAGEDAFFRLLPTGLDPDECLVRIQSDPIPLKRKPEWGTRNTERAVGFLVPDAALT